MSAACDLRERDLTSQVITIKIRCDHLFFPFLIIAGDWSVVVSANRPQLENSGLPAPYRVQRTRMDRTGNRSNSCFKNARVSSSKT